MVMLPEMQHALAESNQWCSSDLQVVSQDVSAAQVYVAIDIRQVLSQPCYLEASVLTYWTCRLSLSPCAKVMHLHIHLSTLAKREQRLCANRFSQSLLCENNEAHE